MRVERLVTIGKFFVNAGCKTPHKMAPSSFHPQNQILTESLIALTGLKAYIDTFELLALAFPAHLTSMGYVSPTCLARLSRCFTLPYTVHQNSVGSLCG